MDKTISTYKLLKTKGLDEALALIDKEKETQLKKVDDGELNPSFEISIAPVWRKVFAPSFYESMGLSHEDAIAMSMLSEDELKTVESRSREVMRALKNAQHEVKVALVKRNVADISYLSRRQIDYLIKTTENSSLCSESFIMEVEKAVDFYFTMLKCK